MSTKGTARPTHASSICAQSSQPYIFKALSTNPNAPEIRLLSQIDVDHNDIISCQMNQFKLDQLPPFRALSYTWRGDVDDGKTESIRTNIIFINNRPIPIGENLVSALRAIRDLSRDRKECIWADAICIDQSNLDERASQVTLMGEIYSKADSVFVWLGEEANDSDVAVEFIKLLSSCHRDGEVGQARVMAIAHDTSYEVHWKALNALWKRRWWLRGWVLQEVVLARTTDFCCGRRILSGADVFNHDQALRVDWEEICNILDKKYGLDLHEHTFHILDGIKRLKDARLSGNTMSFIKCHYRTMSSKVTDPRDEIFSRIGMASDGFVAKPSYTDSLSDVFSTFVMNHIIETKSLEMLSYNTRPRSTPQLPSWSPEWMSETAAGLIEPHNSGDTLGCASRYSASADEPAQAHFDLSDPSRKILNCKGYVFDIVDGVSHAEELPPHAMQDPSPMTQPRSAACVYPSEELIFEGLWKAVIINQEKDAFVPAETGLILATCFKEADARLKSTGPDKSHWRFDWRCSWIGAFMLFGKTVSERMAQATAVIPVPSVTASRRGDVERSMGHGMNFKRLITTDRGYLGTAPYETQSGDIVTILLGSPVPIILRPLSSGMCSVVGAAYISGIMDGESIGQLRQTRSTPDTFSLV
ncbi:heterokaryon incompatibility protein-domain-containing protein [Xylaria scruposa]|nr:heterokaryon incompatibility protein-domain-containing protein [Xylaria scruposa]